MLKVKHITLVKNRELTKEDCKSINLIIGSNNAGKTSFLNDLFQELQGLHAHPPGNHWIFGLMVALENAEKDINKIFPTLLNRNEDFVNYGDVNENIFLGEKKEQKMGWSQAAQDYLRKADKNNYVYESTYAHSVRNNDMYNLFSFLTEILVKIENCINRLDENFATIIQDFNVQPKEANFIFHLYKNRKVFSEIQKNVLQVYDLEIDFDNLQQGYKPLRILQGKVDRSISDQFLLAKEWERKSYPLSSVGHGIRAYLKLVFTLLQPSNKIILIDEPEMFIHPPQRRTLGKLISDIAIRENKQLFISTHDAEFMRGVLSGSNDVKVFHLFGKANKHYYKTIESTEILSLINKQSSNLLNERILNSLFYKKTVLCEDENDRVFYEESMAQYHWEKFHDINFVGFNGKDMAMVIFNKLRELGTEPTIILDIDYLVQGKFPKVQDKNLEKRYNALKLLLQNENFKSNSSQYTRFKSIGTKMFRGKKYETIGKEVKQIINDFKKYSVFIVPYGELESWSGSAKNDIPNALIKMRSKKLRPLSEFLKQIGKDK